ncbi:MAG: NAD+ synthase [Thermoplasmata archaeon]
MSRNDGSLDDDITVIHEFIKDKVEKTGSNGVVMGLSGGLDSSTVLKLCIDALDKEKVHCIIMPEDATPDVDMDDARWLVDEWGVEWDEVPIDGILDSFPVDEDKRIPYANLKARVRMCIWYYFANVEKKLVVGCSNKSEVLLGYTTKYGDCAADFLPIGDVFKSDLKEMAKSIGVPERFLDKTPRAGLWKGQTDEEELGYSYETLDVVLKGIEGLNPVEDIVEKSGLTLDEVKNIKRTVERNAHKRKIPTIVKLRSRTVGLDWREYSY